MYDGYFYTLHFERHLPLYISFWDTPHSIMISKYSEKNPDNPGSFSKGKEKHLPHGTGDAITSR